jgi:DivIVA domain-containing protein
MAGAAREPGTCHTRRMPDVQFAVVLRGYRRAEVDALVQLVNQALRSGDPAARDRAAAALQAATFPLAIRGYDRSQVDAWARSVTARL